MGHWSLLTGHWWLLIGNCRVVIADWWLLTGKMVIADWGFAKKGRPLGIIVGFPTWIANRIPSRFLNEIHVPLAIHQWLLTNDRGQVTNQQWPITKTNDRWRTTAQHWPVTNDQSTMIPNAAPLRIPYKGWYIPMLIGHCLFWLATGHLPLVAGDCWLAFCHQSLVTNLCSLVTGIWSLLIIGCRSLTSHWSLVIGHCW